MIEKDTTTIVRFYVTTASDGFPAMGQAANISASISIGGGIASSISATITETDSTNLPGWYEFEYEFDTVGNAFITFNCSGCAIMPWEENVVELSGSSAPTAAEVADAVWCWTASIIPGQTSVIPGQNSIYTKVTNIPASVWTNDTRSLTTEVISVNKSLATDISASSIATAVWSDTANYLNTASKGYLQVNGGNVWTQVASHDPITGADTTYGAVLKSRASSSNVTDAKTAIIRAMPDISGLSTFNAATDTVTINATQAATMTTATGFATPTDLAGLSTFNPATDTVTINATQAATMVTADVSGLATPSDIPTSDITAIKTKVDTLHNTDLTGIATSANVSTAQAAIIDHGDENWTGGGSGGGATAQQIWEYPNRTITAATLPNNASLATAANISAAITDIENYGQQHWITATGFSTFDPATDTVLIDSTQAASMATATGFATPADITASQADIIAAVNGIDISSLATSTEVAVLADLQKDLNAGVLNWSVTANALTIYNDNNSIRATYTLTRDEEGNITRIQPNS